MQLLSLVKTFALVVAAASQAAASRAEKGCVHNPCTVGAALTCEAGKSIEDPYCELYMWDDLCVGRYKKLGGSCPDFYPFSRNCHHSVCEVGGGMDPTCDRCAAEVIMRDATCEDEWSAKCVARVATACGISCAEIEGKPLLHVFERRAATGTQASAPAPTSTSTKPPPSSTQSGLPPPATTSSNPPPPSSSSSHPPKSYTSGSQLPTYAATTSAAAVAAATTSSAAAAAVSTSKASTSPAVTVATSSVAAAAAVSSTTTTSPVAVTATTTTTTTTKVTTTTAAVASSATYTYGDYNDTWGNWTYNDTWGNWTYNDTWGNWTYNDTWGNWTYNDTWGNWTYNDTWGNWTYNDTWGNWTYNDTWGNWTNNDTHTGNDCWPQGNTACIDFGFTDPNFYNNVTFLDSLPFTLPTDGFSTTFVQMVDIGGGIFYTITIDLTTFDVIIQDENLDTFATAKFTTPTSALVTLVSGEKFMLQNLDTSDLNGLFATVLFQINKKLEAAGTSVAAVIAKVGGSTRTKPIIVKPNGAGRVASSVMVGFVSIVVAMML
ncbi:hypothetical protein HDU97_005390 [Phlyctochytrium planicorne]|nr:hypothetical protein HDU97_005390 [Phlyctochytrium planicorne]